MNKRHLSFLFLFLLLTGPTGLHAQVLTLKEAMQTAMRNYGTIKAKANYARAGAAAVAGSKRDYLPNLVLAGQQDYGTVNGQNGPLYGFGGYGVASSGLPLPDQNWNAAFGSLYLANVNWEFFSFGRARSKVKLARKALAEDKLDLEQELFQHQVKVGAVYLNLLAARRIVLTQQRNLERSLTIRGATVAGAVSGLVAGVDSSQANAEVSHARITLVKAREAEQELASQLAVLMGVPASGTFVLDSSLVTRIPSLGVRDNIAADNHPVIQYYKSRVDVGTAQVHYYRKMYYPSFLLFGVMQTRGSGFSSNYALDQTAFTRDFLEGIKPVRSNYLLGVGLSWNLTSVPRTQALVKSQRYVTDALQDEYLLARQGLEAALLLADQKMQHAWDNYREIPVQLRAASDAYQQKNVLYRNGLTTIVEVTQTLYALNRAETERDVISSNVWQALLLKAAAAGDLDIFLDAL